MRASSDAFARAVAGSHRIATRVDVVRDRATVLEGLQVVDGSITYDRGAARLARVTMTVADPDRVPVSADDLLTPFGIELLVWRGIELATGPELMPMGVFPLQSSTVDGVTLLTSLSGEDRSRLVTDARFEDTVQIAAGTNYVTAIETLIGDGVPDLEYLFPTTTRTTPLLTFDAGDDRWAAAQQMARSLGNEILFDGVGRCIMRAEPTFDGEPVASISEGLNMVSVSVDLDRGAAYNRVVATSSNASVAVPVRGVATDDDPASPTYYHGPFGKRPRFYSSPFIATTVQAESAAAAVLAANLGVAKSVDFAAVPDPRLECSDVILVKRAALGLDELHIVDTLSIGLGPQGAMAGTTRTGQVTQ